MRRLVTALCLLALPATAQDITPPPLESGTRTQIGDTEFFWQDRGKGPAIILVHGRFGSTLLWQDVAPQLVAAGYRVITRDSRARGHSGTGTGPMTLVRLADDLLRFLDHLELEEAIFFGHSEGALTVMTVMAHHGHRVRAALLAGMTHDQALMNPAIHRTNARIIADARQGRTDHPHLAFYKAGYLAYGRDEAAFAQHLLRSESIWLDPPPFTERQLMSYDQPVLVYRAGRDTVLPPEGFDALAALFRDSEMVNLPQATHGLMRQMPDPVAAAAIEFLARSFPD